MSITQLYTEKNKKSNIWVDEANVQRNIFNIFNIITIFVKDCQGWFN